MSLRQRSVKVRQPGDGVKSESQPSVAKAKPVIPRYVSSREGYLKMPSGLPYNVFFDLSLYSSVIVKLLVFSALLFFLPIATYFYTLQTVFNGMLRQGVSLLKWSDIKPMHI